MRNIKNYETTTELGVSRFVKFDGEGKITPATSSKDNIVGISCATEYDKGDRADIYLQAEITSILAGGSFSAGDALTSNSEGKAIKAEFGDNIGAIALEDATSGDYAQVLVTVTRTISSTAQTTEDESTSND